MHEVIPSINCSLGDSECVASHIATTREFEGVRWVHLDIADGVFTPHKTWNEPAQWKKLKCPYKAEVHLMVDAPEHWAGEWLGAGAARLIVHTSVLTQASWDAIVKTASERNTELILGLNPETSPQEAEPYREHASGFLVLGVHPGLSGQAFLPLVLKKIRVLREEHPDATIEIDGGVDAEFGRLALRAGANVLVSATHIFGSGSPYKAYKELQSLSV